MVMSQRDLSIKALQHQAEKMKFRSINKFPPASIGDTVRVTIPDVDRGRGDPRNILFAVVSINDEDYYELGNKEGTIEQYYTRSQFDVCPEPFIKVDEVSNVKKSLREIAKNMSLLGGQGYQRCACKSNCKTNKCKCKASGIFCNSKCHQSLPCSNK